MSPPERRERKTHADYTVGWVCALAKEQTVAIGLLDEEHDDLPSPPSDKNAYTLGSMSGHNVVIACLPKGDTGPNPATRVATSMLSTYGHIRFGLMVGIGGGIPSKVRLGDVVVSIPVLNYPGVIQWDRGKAESGGRFTPTGSLNRPPETLLTALPKLESRNTLRKSEIPEILKDLAKRWRDLPRTYTECKDLRDPLCASDIEMGNASTSGENTKKEAKLSVHFGLIASGNQVIKDASFRDKLVERYPELLCIEMEAAGLMNNFSCLIIRGISDYADGDKNDDWHGFAAARAAAFAKELLRYVQPEAVDKIDLAKDVVGYVGQMQGDLAAIKDISISADKKQHQREYQESLDWLTPINYGPVQSDIFTKREEETGVWFLAAKEFESWREASKQEAEKQTLFCPGIPGAGKTVITSIVVDHLEKRYGQDPSVGIAYVYCNFKAQSEQQLGDMLASILKQLASRSSTPLDCIFKVHNEHKKNNTRLSTEELSRLLHSITEMHERVFILIDGLDECPTFDSRCTKLLRKLFDLQKSHNVSLFATSRHIPEIVDHFQTATSLEIRASDDDVVKYLENHIDQLPSIVKRDLQLRARVVKAVSKAVSGMFLLAFLYIQSLADKMTLNDIESAITDFQGRTTGSDRDCDNSNVLDSAYRDAMTRINGQMQGRKELAMNVLLWISCAVTQLSPEDLRHALATKPGASTLDPSDLPDIEDMASVCAGLVTLDKSSNIIRLSHYTTQEYFIRTREHWFSEPVQRIIETCVTYLSISSTEVSPYPGYYPLPAFYCYAAQNWVCHLPRNAEPSQAVINFFMDRVGLSTWCRLWQPCEFGHSSCVAGLHITAYLGWPEATKCLLGLGERPNEIDGRGKTPLWYACSRGDEQTVTFLLEASATAHAFSSDDFVDALFGALQLRQVTIFEKVLKAGLDANATFLAGKPELLTEVILCGGSRDSPRRGLVLKLLEGGAEVNACRRKGSKYDTSMPPLLAAIRTCSFDVAERLLAAGADPNGVDRRGFLAADPGTALIAAVQLGSRHMLERLISLGADVNLKLGTDFRARTALQAATSNCHLEAVELLLAAGANAAVCDRFGTFKLPFVLRAAVLSDGFQSGATVLPPLTIGGILPTKVSSWVSLTRKLLESMVEEDRIPCLKPVAADLGPEAHAVLSPIIEEYYTDESLGENDIVSLIYTARYINDVRSFEFFLHKALESDWWMATSDYYHPLHYMCSYAMGEALRERGAKLVDERPSVDVRQPHSRNRRSRNPTTLRRSSRLRSMNGRPSR